MSIAKWIFYNKASKLPDGRNRKEQLRIHHSDSQCPRLPDCRCDYRVQVVITGVSDYEFSLERMSRGVARNNREMVKEMAIALQTKYGIGPGGLFLSESSDEKSYLLMALGESENVKIMERPFEYGFVPSSSDVPPVSPDVVIAAMVADYLDIKEVFPAVTPEYMLTQVFRPSERFPNIHYKFTGQVPTLQALAMRAAGEYHGAFGDRVGEDGVARPTVISATAGLDVNRKYVRKLAELSQPVRHLTKLQKTVLQKTDEAFDRMHHANDALSCLGKYPAEILPSFFRNVPLQSSNGLFECEVRVVNEDGVGYKISARSKKFENYTAVMTELFTHMSNRTPFGVAWAVSPKGELKFATDKQQTKDQFEAWVQKHRIFVVPSSLLIYAERMVMTLSKVIFNCTDIKIGHKWPHGGADRLFPDLDLEDVIFGDGDFRTLDITLHQILMRLFYSMLLVFYGPGRDRNLMEWIVEQLVSHVTVRITHLFSGLWARIYGEMPSGLWGTSLGDSWIVMFLYYLFVACTLADIPGEEERSVVEAGLESKKIGIIVYGDDHITKTLSGYLAIFGEQAYADWLTKIWGMEIRQLNPNLPLVTQTHHGEVVEKKKGVVFLKNYIIDNFLELENKPKYLPFRAKSEVCVKAIWGRSSLSRGPVEGMLSATGIAYGMMGTNPRAHRWLENFFAACKAAVPLGLDDPLVQRAASSFDLRKYRQYGLTLPILMKGFPTLAHVQSMNEDDPAYHRVSRELDDDRIFYDEE